MEESERYFAAIRDGDVPSLRAVLDERPELLRATTGPECEPERAIECTGLHIAVHADRLEAARLLLDAGIDIEARTTEGRTALHDSIELCRPSITELLIERGAYVDLCSAAILGKIERVHELLDAAPELANDRSTGLSPLGWASFGNQVDVAAALLDHGARMDDGELLCAAAVGHVEVGTLLIERGADPAALDRIGANALHAAAAMKYTHDSSRFVEMLLARGVDAAIRTTDGRTALDIAEEKERAQRAAATPEEERRAFAEVARILRRHAP